MKEITSLGNVVVKDVCNLKQKKYRERSGSFVVEGLRAVGRGAGSTRHAGRAQGRLRGHGGEYDRRQQAHYCVRQQW